MPFDACSRRPSYGIAIAHTVSEANPQRAFFVLPLELYLNVLDQLVASVDGLQPISYEPSHAITKALCNLALVSRSTSPVASRYLYTYCFCLNNYTNLSLLWRTSDLRLAKSPQVISHATEPIRDDHLFPEMSRFITSAFVSPLETERDSSAMPLIRLPRVIGLCKAIAQNPKRLALDLQPLNGCGS